MLNIIYYMNIKFFDNKYYYNYYYYITIKFI